MPWFKVDDQLFFNAKTVIAGNSAMGLWVRAGSWSSANLTDGFIPTHMANAMANPMANPCDPDALVAAGLWEVAEGGYKFHDWEDFQPSAAVEREKRKKRAEAGRLGAMARWGSKPDGNTDGKRHSKSHADGMANARQTDAPSRPDPSLKNTGAYTPEFETFWKAYPRKKDKAPAFKAWKSAMKHTTPEAATTAAQMYARECRAEGTAEKFIKHGATWLNGKAWENYQITTITRGDGQQVPELSKTECDDILGGPDYWVPPSPPPGLSLQEEREWKQARATEHLNERRQKAWEVVNSGSNAA